jgi:DNA-binding SARP family transcriptional activator
VHLFLLSRESDVPRIDTGGNTRAFRRAAERVRNAGHVEFRVLGPLEVVDGGQPVDLPRRKHRALLAALLLHAGEPVSSDRLIEELWGERPPRTARDALQNYVSLVRKALGADVLVTRSGSYLLDVSPEQIDAALFERLTAEARATEAADARVEKLREALALWRGPPLADLAYEPFAAVEIARLEELRLAAREDLIDAELELGRHADLVPELEGLIQEHPFDERLRGQLMLALYRAGRQAEALDAYQAARRVLDEELGLEPGPPLRELEQAILQQDPALRTTPVARPVTTPSRRTVTVLFADLVDSTRLVESLDAEAARTLLERYFAAARAATERHGGVVEKFIGDAVMAVFGVPRAHEDDALRAVRAAVEISETVPAIDKRLVVRIGINTGEVIAGGAGETLVTGAAVVLAKRLEQAARGGEVLVGASTLRLVRDAVRSRRRKRRGLVSFEVQEPIPGAPGLARQFDTPLVGRRLELDRLREAFAAARDEARCVVFTVVGEAGIGKTRLARELIAQVEDKATVLVGRCVAYGEGATFLPLVEMIGPEVLAAGSTGEIFLAARRRFEELAAERPLALLFEDVHWAEPTLLDFVGYLGAQATGSPILALCLARPDPAVERPGPTPSLVLEPLTDEQARELAGDEHAERIVEIAEGNPLYVQQLAAYVAEEGAAALESVPGSIEALLASRLDRLGADERATAQRAAVVGWRFSPAAAAALGPLDGLAGLERGGFVHRAGDVYRFHHVLVRDVVYAGTPKAERAELHRQHADWLDGQPDSSDELVGYHLERAAGYLGELGAPGQQVTRIATNAGRRLGAAGIAAWKRGDATATVNLLGRATKLLPRNDSERLGLMCELGGALRTTSSFAEAEPVLCAVREGARKSGEKRIELRAELDLLHLALSTNPANRTQELVERATAAIPLLEQQGDDRALGRAWFYVANVRGPYHCRYVDAEAATRKAILHYKRAGWPASACLSLLASALTNGPTPVDDALAACEELLADADQMGQASIVSLLALLKAMRGTFEEARALVGLAREIYAQLGQSLTAEYTCGRTESQVELLAGDLDRAQASLERSYSVLKQHRERSHLATRAAMLADVLYRRECWKESEAYVSAAESYSVADDVVTEWLWRSAKARLQARAGRHESAQQLVEAAVSILADTDALNYQAACSLDFAEVHRLAGRSAQAATAVEEAIGLYELKGNIVAAARARAFPRNSGELLV